MRRGALAVMSGTLLLCAHYPDSSSAQVNDPLDNLLPRFDSIRPYEMEEEVVEPELPPEVQDPSAQPGEEDVLLESLQGLFFTPDKTQILKEGRPDVKGVEFDGLQDLQTDAFQLRMDTFIGQPVTLLKLRDIVQSVVQYYRSLDMPVVDVIIGEQDITKGVIQIQILEGKVGEVLAEENRWFSKRQLTRQVRMKRAQRILAEPLIEDIKYLNKNAFRDVDVVFAPGEDEGSTNVILKVKDRLPFRFYAGYDDTGNDLTGEERFFFGANWGNAFWSDHTLSYQFTASSDFATLQAHSVTYQVPVRRGHDLSTFFSYSIADAETGVGAGAAPPVLNGEAVQAGWDYRIELPTPSKKFIHGIAPGFAFRKIDNRLDLLATNLRRERFEVLQWSLAYDARLFDPWGLTMLEATAYHSFGNWTSLNGADEFNANVNANGSRAGADPQYSYLVTSVERYNKLPFDFEFRGRLTWQFADSNLVSTEQLSAGGAYSVRGYTESEIRGDEGYVFSLELRTPAISIGEFFGVENAKDEIIFLGFWDYASIHNRTLAPAENPDAELSGAGGGVRINYDRFFSLRADYGFQLVDSGFNNRFNSRLHLGIVLSY